MPATAQKLVSGLKTFFAERGFQKAVLGLSGGVDSALTLAIAVRALGNENVTALILPEENVSSPVSAELAQKFADELKVSTFTQPLTPLLNNLQNLPWGHSAIANQNLRPRLRTLLLYHFARKHNTLVLGTSNKSEILLGYGTKWGDFAADVEVIGSLYKTEVWALAKNLNVPIAIIDRVPTAELALGVTDESELGAHYSVLDPILQELEKRNFELPEYADELTENILARVLANRHKTELAPVI